LEVPAAIDYRGRDLSTELGGVIARVR
jgi:hypothetical protein